MRTLPRMTNSIDRTMENFRKSPEYFFKNVLKVNLWDKQLQLANMVRDHKRVAAKSGHSVGKTYATACISLWFLYSHLPAKVIVTAPVFSQIRDIFFSRLKGIHSRAKYSSGTRELGLGGRIMDVKFKLTDEWGIFGVSNNPTRSEGFQGQHEDNILFIFDEASGIHPKIYEVVEGGLASEKSKILLIGNPTLSSGGFYDAFKDESFSKLTISPTDIPNVRLRKEVIPGLTSWKWVEHMKKKYGADSDIYRVRVLGEFPKHSSNSVISIDEVEKARQRGLSEGLDKSLNETIQGILGVDVARFGDDKSVIARRVEDEAIILKVFEGKPVNEIIGECRRLLKRFPKDIIRIDEIGVGGGVVDMLKEDDRIRERIEAVNVAEKAVDSEKFINTRSELWWSLREWLPSAKLGVEENLVNQGYSNNVLDELSQPTYSLTSRGQIQVESKDKMKARGISSPDYADAIIHTFYNRNTSVAIYIG